MQALPLDFRRIKMADEYLEMFDELSNLISDDNIPTGSDILKILKKYSSTISVFDMMEFTSHVMKENKYVQESYREEGQKSYIESFLMRIKDIMNDNSNYEEKIDRKPFDDAVETLKNHYQTGIHDSKSKSLLIFEIASIYSTFILKEPIHRVGTVFPGSLKVEKKNDKFLCPVKDANIDTPNAVCNICLAEQLDF